MNEGIIALAAITFGIAAGLWLYGRFAMASSTAVAIFGLIRNGFLLLTGIFLIIGFGWIGLIMGVLFIMVAIFLGSGHADNLGENDSLRKRLSG